MSDLRATVIGGGLAGCEAAWQLAVRGIHVRLLEMKPERMSPAHHSEGLAELVCSNSFRGDRLTNAVGLLKEEMRLMGSLILRCADETPPSRLRRDTSPFRGGFGNAKIWLPPLKGCGSPVENSTKSKHRP